MKFFKILAQGINGKAALAILFFIISVHLVLMSLYLHKNSLARKAEYHTLMAQKIMNTVYMLSATPEEDRKNAVLAISESDINVSLSKSPAWEKRIPTVSFWKITHTLEKTPEAKKISIKLDNEDWINIEKLNKNISLSFFITLISIEVIILGSILITAWSVSRFTRALENLKKASRQISLDLHAPPISIEGPAVVQETAQSLNEMQRKIQKLIRDRTQVLASISHDLRTPITRMKLRAHFILDNNLAEGYIKDLDEMEAMIKETLYFTKYGRSYENKSLINLHTVLETIHSEATELGHPVHYTSRQQKAYLYGQELSLKRALNNLIYNALRYGKSATILLHTSNHQYHILIEDTGPGIPEAELDQVFSAFYRGEASRSKHTGGVGLGLAISKNIIEAHGGAITLENLPNNGGLRAIVALNKNEETC